MTKKDDEKTDGASLLPADPSASPASTEALPNVDALLAFARWALDGYITDENHIGDLDGYDLEQKALELGLLRQCGEGYAAATWLEVGSGTEPASAERTAEWARAQREDRTNESGFALLSREDREQALNQQTAYVLTLELYERTGTSADRDQAEVYHGKARRFLKLEAGQ